jgi:cellulose biosynthesis protein BcsQ
MDSRGREAGDEEAIAGTPEDVAALYSWANLQGAKYRDFSASRREYRAQVRYRAAVALRERELLAQAAAEEAAAAAERAAAIAEEAAQQDTSDGQTFRAHLLRSAEAATRRAVAERVEAARHADAAAQAAVVAQREEREIAEAHASAQLQAQRYADAAEEGAVGAHAENGAGGTPVASNGLSAEMSIETEPVAERASAAIEAEHAGPAWLQTTQTAPRTGVATGTVTQAISQTFGGETLQDSRERVASRWFALKGVFEHAGPELPAMQPLRRDEGRMPVLAIFSLAGGVGKTSLAATLGRALSSQGERVVLTDTTSHGLLPFYFGARELRPGVVRTFSPPVGGTGEPIALVSYELDGMGEDEARQRKLMEEIPRNAQCNDRVVLDLSSGSSWLIRRMAELQPTVLVPMAPDMNSVIGLQAVERVFQGIVDGEGRTLLPFYVLNQFDASLPLHLDVREVFRRQLGDRLVRFAIRRSPAVSEALAEGMTVVDYAPDAPVSQDYRDVASWLRSVSSPATALDQRGSER